MKLITLTLEGRFKHVWIEGVHQNIPEDVVEVSDSDFLLLSQNAETKKYDIVTSEVVGYTAPFDFESSLEIKKTEITNAFKAAMSVITNSYTSEDIASFPTQENEAVAWVSDNTSATPFIDGLLSNRPGIDKATLAQRIIDNASTYKLLAGPLIGKKQAYEDQLYLLQSQQSDPLQPEVTQVDFDAIVVSFE